MMNYPWTVCRQGQTILPSILDNIPGARATKLPSSNPPGVSGWAMRLRMSSCLKAPKTKVCPSSKQTSTWAGVLQSLLWPYEKENWEGSCRMMWMYLNIFHYLKHRLMPKFQNQNMNWRYQCTTCWTDAGDDEWLWLWHDRHPWFLQVIRSTTSKTFVEVGGAIITEFQPKVLQTQPPLRSGELMASMLRNDWTCHIVWVLSMASTVSISMLLTTLAANTIITKTSWVSPCRHWWMPVMSSCRSILVPIVLAQMHRYTMDSCYQAIKRKTIQWSLAHFNEDQWVTFFIMPEDAFVVQLRLFT